MRSLLGQTSRLAIWAVLAAGIAIPSLAVAQSDDAGFGKDIPLGMAIKRLAPNGAEVKMAPGVDPKAKVSWSGGGWQDALGSAARGVGYTVNVRGDKIEIGKAGVNMVSSESAGEPEAGALGTQRRREVREDREERVSRRVERRAERAEARREWRRPAPVARAHRPRHVEVATAETVSGGGFVMLPVRSEAPRPAKAAWREPGADVEGIAPPPAGGALVVQQGDNLRAVLADWTARNGWRLVWNSEFSYRLDSAARFQGGFVEATGELLKSMRAVRPLVTASFFQGNKTLVIGNDSSDAAGN